MMHAYVGVELINKLYETGEGLLDHILSHLFFIFSHLSYRLANIIYIYIYIYIYIIT